MKHSGKKRLAQRITDSLDLRIEVAKTQRVSRYVEVNVNHILAELKKSPKILDIINDDKIAGDNPNLIALGSVDIHLSHR